MVCFLFDWFFFVFLFVFLSSVCIIGLGLLLLSQILLQLCWLVLINQRYQCALVNVQSTPIKLCKTVRRKVHKTVGLKIKKKKKKNQTTKHVVKKRYLARIFFQIVQLSVLNLVSEIFRSIYQVRFEYSSMKVIILSLKLMKTYTEESMSQPNQH